MTTFAAIDLSGLSCPDVVEAVDFESVFAEMLADLQSRDNSFSALVESDPAYIVLEVAAYREVTLRQRVNDAAKAVMLAYAMGADLDNLLALVPMERKVEVEGDPNAVPPTEDEMEGDDDFRARGQLAPEGFSVAGPDGAYIYHALTVSGVSSASVTSPNPGEVVVYVLSNEGDGTPSEALLTGVENVLSAEDMRPLTDFVAVEAATIIEYAVEAVLTLGSGPSTDSVQAEALATIKEYVAERHAMGKNVPLSGIYKALHISGVVSVALASPTEDITVAESAAAYCTSISVSVEGAV